MSKPKLVSVAPDLNVSLDWDVCALCQRREGVFVCPANNVVEARRNAGYISLATNLEQLRPFRYVLESGLPVENLDEGGGILQTLKTRKAKYHKACSLKYLQPKFDVVLEIEKKKKNLLDSEDTDETVEKKSTRLSDPFINLKEDKCFFCKSPEKWNEPLRRCVAAEVYRKIRSCAEILCDIDLIAITADEQILTQEGKYHLRCLFRLYNKASKKSCQNDADEDRIMCEGMAFADVVLYIREKLKLSQNNVFEMVKLMNWYRQRLASLLGIPEQELIKEHTTRFREKILAYFPNLIAEKFGREYLLMVKNTKMLTALDKEDQDEDALAFHNIGKGLRRAIAACDTTFNGSFAENCEESCIPPPLLGAINILLYGSTTRENCRATKPVISICQLIMLNYHRSQPQGQIVRNVRNRTPPLPLYIGLSIYGKGREKKFIDELHERGLSISHTKVMEVTSQLCRLVVERSKEVGIVCPSNLKHGLFTVSALDNIDHKTNSTTSRNEFHGTGISIFQLTETDVVPKDQTFCTSFLDVEHKGNQSVPELPDFYSNISECILPRKVAPAHCFSEDVGKEMLSSDDVQMIWETEASWLAHVHDQMAQEDGEISPNVSWGAYHASLSTKVISPAINAILPLFHEKSTDPGMIKHGMTLVRNITQRVNGDQIPVICVDQQLYCLCKYIQWQYPEEFGEGSFIVMLGPLHIEKSFLAILGQYLEDSGWVSVMAHSGVITSGSAEGLLKVSNIMKARAIHQVTACALHSLLLDAYDQENPDRTITLKEWVYEKSKTNPNFKYWSTLLNLEILLLLFVRSIRDANFKLYKESMKEMMPWYFTFDHQNYARWLPIHLGDMIELKIKAPSINAEFESGKFVVPITAAKFSALGIDHAHEQNNARIKGKGGAIGLTEDPSSLRRYTVGSPEVSRLLEEFGGTHDAKRPSEHHEQYASFQRKFLNNCIAVKESFAQCENPFKGDNKDLVNISTRLVMSKKSLNTLNTLVADGKFTCKNFVQERLLENKTSLHDRIKKANVKIFVATKRKIPKTEALRSLKLDAQLFMRLFIVSTTRDLDLREFFKHENQKYPPALSQHGEIRPGNKADLLNILEKLVPSPEIPTQCQGLVVDGAGLVHIIKPTGATKSLYEYCSKQFCPILLQTAHSVGALRVDVAWDLYSHTTIKGTTRDRRGAGVRQKGIPERGILPKNWEEYLKNSENKEELFSFLARNLAISLTNIQVVTNVDVTIVSSPVSASLLHGIDVSHMEEADGRIFLHVKDMIAQGTTSILIRCSDTDVVVIGISHFHNLQEEGLSQLWVLFGNGAKKRYIPIHKIAENLGREKAVALRGWHSFTGCDSTSFFASKGKRSAWSAWKDSAVTAAFNCLALPPSVKDITDEHVITLETFTNKMYNPRCDLTQVNEARHQMFVSGEKSLSVIPPTSAALLQHIKRAKYQAGEIWGRALESHVTNRPSPELWGWKRRADSRLEPHWTDLDWVWESVKELDRCGCRAGCESNRCSCRRNNLPCTPACKICQGDCRNTNKNCIEDDEDEI